MQSNSNAINSAAMKVIMFGFISAQCDAILQQYKLQPPKSQHLFQLKLNFITVIIIIHFICKVLFYTQSANNKKHKSKQQCNGQWHKAKTLKAHNNAGTNVVNSMFKKVCFKKFLKTKDTGGRGLVYRVGFAWISAGKIKKLKNCHYQISNLEKKVYR